MLASEPRRCISSVCTVHVACVYVPCCCPSKAATFLTFVGDWCPQVLAGTSSGNYAATIPPEWARDQQWRSTAKQLLAQAPGLNDSQRRWEFVQNPAWSFRSGLP